MWVLFPLLAHNGMARQIPGLPVAAWAYRPCVTRVVSAGGGEIAPADAAAMIAGMPHNADYGLVEVPSP